MPEESDRDIRQEVGISLFWRELIGDYDYGRFNPEDMLRWYDALELRGPDEIRELIDERYSGRPMSAVHGIVAAAPHPPLWLVREWVEHYETKVSTSGYWLGAICFVLLAFAIAPFLNSVQSLTPLSTYIMQPPFGGPQTFQPASTSQNNDSLSATVTSPPAISTPGPTGPQSGGIAGVATGSSPAGGTTGAANIGLSAGATSPAPAVGNTQP